MVCRKLYDIKKLAYVTADYADYMSDIATSGFQEILIHRDGLTLDTKGETADFTVLNGTRYTDGERVPMRVGGTLKFTKNVDSSLLVNHKVLIDAGLGLCSSAVTSAVTVTDGKGSVADPFLTTNTSGISVGDIIKIPTFGYRVVLSIITNTSFVVDTPLSNDISTSTVFSKPILTDLTNPIGNCVNTFNFVLSLSDESYIKMMGCNVTCEFAPVYEKQLTINFTITSPDITEVGTAPTGFSTATVETKGSPVMCNFTYSNVSTAGVAESYFPINFELGLTVTSEPMKAIGGRNNVLGYINRSSLKPKITLDRVSMCKAWVNAPRTSRSWIFGQNDFAIIIQSGLLTLTDLSINNNNHESIVCEMDVNYDVNYRVYLVLPPTTL